MKNSEIASAIIGSTFFAVPYLFLAVPLAPSLAIGGAAFIAGELVLKKGKQKLKETNFSLYETLENAKKQNKHILEMTKLIEDDDINRNLKEINDTVSKIIKTIEKNPDRVKKLKNFFDYYLPVVVKLVDRFDEIENQKLSNSEIKKFNENTSRMIEEINDVFKKFLNNLYESDMLDANVEMKVLNSMIKSDGLDKNLIGGNHE